MDTSVRTLFAVLAVGLVVGSGLTAAVGLILGDAGGALAPTAPGVENDTDTAGDGKLVAFVNESAYAAYVQRGRAVDYHGGFNRAAAGDDDAATEVAVDRERTTVTEQATATPMATEAAESGGGAGGDDGEERRVGTTNVQETGVDEPSIVKTDGRHFFYAPRGRVAPYEHHHREDDDGPRARTHVVDAKEPNDPELVGQINESGTMLRSGDALVVLAGDEVIGYDVGDASGPKRTWSRQLNGSLVTARMVGGELYLVTRSRAATDDPCPLTPLGSDAAVECTDVYRPREQVPVDATYVAFAVDPADGTVDDATGFVGSARNTVVYASQGALYVTYTDRRGETALMTEYLINESEEVPPRVERRLREIRSYDISERSKRHEVQRAIRNWFRSMPEEERERAQESLREGFRAYANDHQREGAKTGVVRVAVGGGELTIDGVGTVPGVPLNQFSMDQADGTLRIATTVPRVAGAESENDLYVLDTEDMSVQGSVTGMGVDERVYAVRYVGDTAYVVTFRQVDPFHVVDLSDPSDPKELGEVKLPGYSDYLHPVGEDRILGIGEEDGQVKAVLFNVSDPTNPTVEDDLKLDAHWSAVSRTHHAFMQDRKHGVFFLPTGEQGLVVDYTGGTLDVEKRIYLDGRAQRARYVQDSLYVFGTGEIEVYDEATWKQTASLSLDNEE